MTTPATPNVFVGSTEDTSKGGLFVNTSSTNLATEAPESSSTATPAAPDIFSGSTDNAADGSLFTDVNVSGLADDNKIVEIIAGAGLTGTSLTGPQATLEIDSTVATLIGTQTLTNKTLASPVITGGFIATGFSTVDGNFRISSLNSGSNPSPTFELLRADGIPAANDFLGSIQFKGTDSSGDFPAYANIYARSTVVTDGNESGRFEFWMQHNGSFTQSYSFESNRLTLWNDGKINFYNAANNAILSLLPETTTVNRTVTIPNATGILSLTTATETLTNKTLTSPVINTSISGSAFLDEDNMASNSATKIASQQSIKAYVDTQVATIPVGDITSVTAGTGLTGGGTSGGVTLNLDVTTLGTVEANKAVTANANGDVKFPDNERIIFGNGNDLIIRHESSSDTSYIESDDNLLIKGDDVFIQNQAGNTNIAKFVDGGGVSLYHNSNTPRFVTTTSGTSTTGIHSASTGFQSSQYFWSTADNVTALFAGANFEIALAHIHNTGFKLTNGGTGSPAVELQFVDSNEAIGSDGTNLILTSGGTEFKIPTSDGSSGQALVTDSNGVLSFASIPQGDVTSVVAGTGMTGGGTSGDVTLNVIGGTGITANADDIAITAAQTGITSVLNTGLIIGAEANHNLDFSTNNQIKVKTGSNVVATFKPGTLDLASGYNIKFEGATDDGFETTLGVVDPTADRTINLPNSSGTLALTTDIPYSVAADDITIGGSPVTIGTSTGNITINALASDADIIFKGTDGTTNITALTLDMSNQGSATFNSGAMFDGTVGNSSSFWMTSDNTLTLMAGVNFEVRLSHVHNTGFKLNNFGTGTPDVELQFVDSNEAIGSDGTNLILTSGGTAFKMPTSDGSSGQALVTDASGNLSFASTGGGGDVTLNGVQTLTNKTLTSPKINENVVVTSTATEINILDGVTATTAELNYNDITTLGTVEASKVVTADSSGNVKFLDSDVIQIGEGTAGSFDIKHVALTSTTGISFIEADQSLRIEGGGVSIKHNSGTGGITTTTDGFLVDGPIKDNGTLVLQGGGLPHKIQLQGYLTGSSPYDGVTYLEYIMMPTLSGTTGSVEIKSVQSDLPMNFSGNDGGTTINALQLDFANNGKAIFRNEIALHGSTIDSNLTTITCVDPTASRTITLPDETGTVSLRNQLKGNATNGAGVFSDELIARKLHTGTILAAQDDSSQGMIAGRPMGGFFSQTSLSNNGIYFMPIMIPGTGAAGNFTVGGFRFRTGFSGSVANNTVKMGLYTLNKFGYPSQLVSKSSRASGTSNNVDLITTPDVTSITPGRYAMAIAATGSGTVIVANFNSSSAGGSFYQEGFCDLMTSAKPTGLFLSNGLSSSELPTDLSSTSGYSDQSTVPFMMITYGSTYTGE